MMNVRSCLVIILCTLVVTSAVVVPTRSTVLAEEPPVSSRNPSPDTAASEAFFETKIRPVLVNSCYRCHGDTKVSGGLRVDSLAALVRGGDAGPAPDRGQTSRRLLHQPINRR
ncbi:MAG: c-type cytochrome domain-containing protein, partial [Planctomycetota bacterium]